MSEPVEEKPEYQEPDDWLKTLQNNLRDRVVRLVISIIRAKGEKGAPEAEVLKLCQWALEPTYKAILAQMLIDGQMIADYKDDSEEPYLLLPEWAPNPQNGHLAKVKQELESDRMAAQKQIDQLSDLVAEQSEQLRELLGKVLKITQKEAIVVAARETVIETKKEPEPEKSIIAPPGLPLPKLPLRFAEERQARNLQARFNAKHISTNCIHENGMWILKEKA